jgi:hypothetical protein
MPPKSATSDAFDRAVAQIPTCALDQGGMREQRARYARLASSVTRVQREPEAVLVEFDPDFDRQALDRALAVERECCPLFRFAFDEQERRLRATVAESEQLSALDAVAHALGAAHRVTPKG